MNSGYRVLARKELSVYGFTLGQAFLGGVWVTARYGNIVSLHSVMF